MCMGYAKEIRTWASEEAGSPYEAVIAAWGHALAVTPDESGRPAHFPLASFAVKPEKRTA